MYLQKCPTYISHPKTCMMQIRKITTLSIMKYLALLRKDKEETMRKYDLICKNVNTDRTVF